MFAMQQADHSSKYALLVCTKGTGASLLIKFERHSSSVNWNGTSRKASMNCLELVLFNEAGLEQYLLAKIKLQIHTWSACTCDIGSLEPFHMPLGKIGTLH